MNTKLMKTAAAIAFIIGVMAIFAGGQVVLGKVMDYYVIYWLPGYNLIVGLISSFFTATAIWRGSKIALPAAIAPLVSHASVLLVLQTVYRDVVAGESIKAMSVRIAVWLIILALMRVAAQSNKRIPKYGIN